MKLLDGKKIAEERLAALRARVATMTHVPSLAVVLVGDDAASHLYVKLKEKAAKKVGIDFHLYKMDTGTPEEKILETIDFLKSDADIDGILVQLPLPDGDDADAVIAAIGKEKDVDGFHAENISAFIAGEDVSWPVFPRALITLAEASGEDITGKSAVVVSKSDIFTHAMTAACTRTGMRVMHVACDKVPCMQAALLSADVVFTACGEGELLAADYFKKGAIVIDGGMRTHDGKTVGDVDDVSLAKKEGHLTPVPGGVGPVTIACLLENVVDLVQKKE